MANKIQLSPKKILNKQFQIDFKGYSATEVDYFLDSVVEDYETFADMLNNSYEQIENLQKENEALKMKISNLEKEKLLQQDNIRSMEDNLSSNVDLLKRISSLEKEVYKGKE
ncbi:DivIVA domain-containing protein [Candidatus Stoquefichus massiliensis]|uniref:DivIVA domain-containing protein n=1 Tax=Candidatus Stoquefichus massiliensis TaxID=1470350 RepID=UPI000485455C|nr:DivIVA domain-containing protein [Candidatus Stoquefichus massiliensis]